MMNSKPRQSANAIVDEVFELLNERHLYKKIDVPIDTAVASFQYDKKSPVTHGYFIEVTSQLVRHIYQSGSLFRQQLTELQSCCETMELLETGYQSPHTRGYHAAYLDALTDLEQVLAQLSIIIKITSRDKYMRWVCITRIDPSDWATKCRIVEALLSRSPSLPSSITNCSPAQLAHHIYQLINVFLSSEHSVENLLSADSEFTPE
jgi:hypothetical protein